MGVAQKMAKRQKQKKNHMTFFSQFWQLEVQGHASLEASRGESFLLLPASWSPRHSLACGHVTLLNACLLMAIFSSYICVLSSSCKSYWSKAALLQ